MKCNHCEKEIQEGSKFCPYCGQKVEQVIKCPNCGNSIRPGDTFCMSCGYKVDTSEIEAQKQESVSNIHQTSTKEVSNNASTPRKTEEGRSKTPMYVGLITCAAIVLAGLLYYLRSTGTNANKPLIEIGDVQYEGSYILKNSSLDRGWKYYDTLSLDIAWPVSINGVEPMQLQGRIIQIIRDQEPEVEILESSNIHNVLKDLYEKKLNYTPPVGVDFEKKILTRWTEAKVAVLASTIKYITFEYTIHSDEGEGWFDSHGYITYDIAKSECVEDRLIDRNSIPELIKKILDEENIDDEYDISDLADLLKVGLSEKGIIYNLDDGYAISCIDKDCSLKQLRDYVSDECVELLTDNKHCDYVKKDIGNNITY